ncbi:MAG TPA: PH domain-containing protein [Thermoplasmata archaeon]|nr:PH domain-containing protein [Thermoplasmata archaeon]
MSPDFPQTESELVQRRPGSNQSGVFPRKWLLRDERILYETRPGLWSLYWGRITLFLAFALLLLVDAMSPEFLYSAAYWGFEGFLFLVPLGLVVLAWRGRAYALTNRRVLSIEGMFSSAFEYANYDEIQNLTSTQGSTGEIRFDVGSAGGGMRARATGRPKRIRWRAVPNTPEVYNFVQDAFRIEVLTAAKDQEYDALVRQTMEGRMVCEYCGGLIDLAQLNSRSPKCPQCGAPVRLERPAY